MAPVARTARIAAPGIPQTKTKVVLVSGDGIAANDYKTYAILMKYAFSKRTSLYGALDRETTSANGTVPTVSGSRSNSALAIGLQTRF